MKSIVLVGGKNLSEIVKEYEDKFNGDIFILDNFSKEPVIYGHKRIDLEEIIENKDIYNIIIPTNTLCSTYELFCLMKEYGIPFEIYNEQRLKSNILNIQGRISSLNFEWGAPKINILTAHQMEKMYRKMFSCNSDDFMDKEIDLFLYIEDMPQDAYRIAEIFNIPYIFAPCTVFPVSERVIPVPNYFSCFDEDCFPFAGESNSELEAASKEEWIYPRAVWKGDLNNTPDDLRRMLFHLGKRYPEYLHIERYDSYWSQVNDGQFGNNFTPMYELARYKYLIDIRGWSFFARFNRLMKMGRVVLRVEIIYKEWYDEYLVPMKHYVPIKSDMSDLIEKIEWLEKNPDIYEEIVQGGREFASEYFTPKAYLEKLKELTLRYCG